MPLEKRKVDLLKSTRKQVVDAVIKHGIKQNKAGEMFGFSKTSVSKYVREYKIFGEASFSYKRRGVSKRTGSLISEAQEKSLIAAVLHHNPDELGLEHTLWTSRVISKYLSQSFCVNYSGRGIRNLMKRLGFSSQKPIKMAYQRDPVKIKEWLEITYPKIKVRASQEKARIYWADEMGIQSTDNRGRTYGLVGQTPTIKKSGTRFRCNVLAAISPQGFMNWMVFDSNFNQQKFIAFLGRMIRQIKQKVFLIVDNHKVHHSKKVKNYVEKHKDNLEIFFLPPYAPDLNPQELVNQDIKANANNFKPLTNLNNLMINVRYYLTTIQFNFAKIINFFKKKEVTYAA
jgi:transposase